MHRTFCQLVLKYFDLFSENFSPNNYDLSQKKWMILNDLAQFKQRQKNPQNTKLRTVVMDSCQIRKTWPG